jgi:hypothetical protein
MKNTIPPHRRVELLLNTLYGERHFRRPLLLEALDSLAALGDRPAALQVARALLRRLDGDIEVAEYEQWVARIVELAVAPDDMSARSTAA